MRNYSQMTKTELIDRLRKFEAGAAAKYNQENEQSIELLHDFRERDERLRSILQTAVDGIITIDENGTIDDFNPAAEKIFGYQASEVIGQNVSVLMPQPYSAEHDRYLAHYKSTGVAKIIGIGREVVGRRKDGSEFPMDLAVGEGKIGDQRLFTGIVRDITERKALEREILEISERERQTIGRDLHDDLGQQLAGIEFMSQTLKQRLAATSAGEARLAGDIAKLVRNAIGHTRNLSRGLSPIILEAEGLMNALKELAETIQGRFKVSCQFRCDKLVKLHNTVAATHLYRIAQEAVHNAVRHGKPGKIEIALTATAELLNLRVNDNGIGFTKNRPRHRGMGLRIMQYRAGVIGGSLAIRHEESGGTSVICSVHNPMKHLSYET